jgi:NAD(P)H-nitrite reductase large subunit
MCARVLSSLLTSWDQNVCKGDIIQSVAGGCTSFGDLKVKTKAGTGCGGCIPLVIKSLHIVRPLFC